jgi:hypothetical protein
MWLSNANGYKPAICAKTVKRFCSPDCLHHAAAQSGRKVAFPSFNPEFIEGLKEGGKAGETPPQKN